MNRIIRIPRIAGQPVEIWRTSYWDGERLGHNHARTLSQTDVCAFFRLEVGLPWVMLATYGDGYESLPGFRRMKP